MNAIDREIYNDDQEARNMAIARNRAPEKCSNCEQLDFVIEDDRFDVLERFPGDTITYGKIDVMPYCKLIESDPRGEECLFDFIEE